MSVYVAENTAKTLLDEITSDADAGSDNAEVEIYDDSDTVLATITMNDPSFEDAAVDEGYVVIEHNDSSDLTSTIDEDGTADHFTLQDSDGNNVLQGDCGEEGDEAELTLNSVNFVVEAEARITSLVIRLPLLT